MYRMNEIDLWSQRRQELGREAEFGHLAQSLQASVRPRAVSGGRA
ncbi:MAG: hypothetical protein K0S10_3201 [Rubrobacteraceae bacterium]|nr:hypothetical protein [Rubrobacteraceae bacterium]